MSPSQLQQRLLGRMAGATFFSNPWYYRQETWLLPQLLDSPSVKWGLFYMLP